MTKIIQIDSYSGIGGGEMVMFNVVQDLKDEFDFVIAAPKGEFLEKYRQMNLRTYQLFRQSIFGNVLKIRKIIKRENPEIIQCHGTRAAFWGRLAVIGLKNKPRIVYTLHGFHIIRRNFFARRILLFIERFLNKWTNVLVCVSEADRGLVLKYKTISQEKIRVIRNGINIRKFQVEQDRVMKTKKELGFGDDFVISAIGRLHPQKDFSTLLKALRIVVDRIKNVKLLIIGDGPLKQNLKEEARSLGIEECVRFLGARKDVPTLLNTSDIAVLSTNWEGLPLILLEAGASGKPVVASDVGGVQEVVKDGETGYLFRPGSEKDLAGKIFILHSSSDLRKKMGEKAFSFISNFFSKEKMAAEYKNLYHSLL